jgi:hypothetical protein
MIFGAGELKKAKTNGKKTGLVETENLRIQLETKQHTVNNLSGGEKI